ncbi:MAG: dCTP deaminase [Candidatus Omnitrophica bacterium]|nr:dCTP deaminase [Candidatus Omnitrophota bacterium]
MDISNGFLNNDETKKFIKERKIIVEPILNKKKQFDNPIGIDLRLDNYFAEFVRTSDPYLSPALKGNGLKFIEKEFFYESYYLQPKEFVLGQTLEYIVLPDNIMCLLSGKSSLGRRGLEVHATANIIDPGWKGHIVFELTNSGNMPIELIPCMRIARIIFSKVAPSKEYNGDFEGQVKIIPPKPDAEMVKLKKFIDQRDSEQRQP